MTSEGGGGRTNADRVNGGSCRTLPPKCGLEYTKGNATRDLSGIQSQVITIYWRSSKLVNGVRYGKIEENKVALKLNFKATLHSSFLPYGAQITNYRYRAEIIIIL